MKRLQIGVLSSANSLLIFLVTLNNHEPGN